MINGKQKPFPVKKYQIIYADPPWQFRNKNTGGSMKSGSANQYSVMSVNDICELPVQDISRQNCILFMWWVSSQPAEALRVVKSWGFELKTMTGFTWVKRTKLGKLHFGMGHYTRQGSENCLIGIKGKSQRVGANIRAVTEHRVLKHSEKPNIFREKIVDLIGNRPRIELFARDRFEGWDAWGNEV